MSGMFGSAGAASSSRPVLLRFHQAICPPSVLDAHRSPNVGTICGPAGKRAHPLARILP
jgi:hypothetical protein